MVLTQLDKRPQQRTKSRMVNVYVKYSPRSRFHFPQFQVPADMNRPAIHHTHSAHAACPRVTHQLSGLPDGVSWFCSAGVQNGPKHRNSDAGSSDMPKRSCQVLLLREKVSTVRYSFTKLKKYNLSYTFTTAYCCNCSIL